MTDPITKKRAWELAQAHAAKLLLEALAKGWPLDEPGLPNMDGALVTTALYNLANRLSNRHISAVGVRW